MELSPQTYISLHQITVEGDMAIVLLPEVNYPEQIMCWRVRRRKTGSAALKTDGAD
jgi:hypothetical protein